MKSRITSLESAAGEIHESIVQKGYGHLFDSTRMAYLHAVCKGTIVENITPFSPEILSPQQPREDSSLQPGNSLKKTRKNSSKSSIKGFEDILPDGKVRIRIQSQEGSDDPDSVNSGIEKTNIAIGSLSPEGALLGHKKA